MRYLATLLFACLLASQYVHACLAGFGDTLFFEAVPSPPPEADLIAEISVSDVKVHGIPATATATITQVIKASDARIRRGDTVVMRYEVTSCGPDYRDGDKGKIIAKTGSDADGRIVLYPYMRKRNDDPLIRPPLSLTVRTPIAQTPPLSREEIAKLNSSCAAFYGNAMEKVRPGDRQSYVEKFNRHKLYAKRLSASIQSVESQYAADLSRRKAEAEKANSEGELFQYRAKWDSYCPSVEFYTSLEIKERELRLNP